MPENSGISANIDISHMTARDLAAAIARRDITSEQALDQLLDRVARLNPGINAVVSMDTEGARTRAREADHALDRGENWGPLHGVPMTIKDTYEVVGMPCTSGAPELAQYMPQSNADAVDRLQAAGAVIFGKTNCPIWAGDLQSFNDVYGQTNNPWNAERTCGGSSGGAAAALAAGLTPLELGSDIGGSIRNPAHFCGVVGHKPSFGIVPIRGHIPGPPGTVSDTDIGVAGPLARSVDDLELAMDILAAPGRQDAKGWRVDLPQPRHADISQYRIAVWADDDACRVDAETAGAIQRAGEALSGMGARVDMDARPAFTLAEAHETYYMLLAAVMAASLPQAMRENMRANPPAADDTSHAAMFRRGAVMDHAEWLMWHEKRERMREQWSAFFADWDVVLCPVVARAAFPHDHSSNFQERRIEIDGQNRQYVDMVMWAGLTCGYYLPATVVPVAQSADGLPIGVQIAGDFMDDRTTLDVARALESAMGGVRTPPGFE